MVDTSLCVILGGFIGVYLQRFPLTERFFRDIIDIGFDLKSLDLIVVDFGLRLYCANEPGNLPRRGDRSTDDQMIRKGFLSSCDVVLASPALEGKSSSGMGWSFRVVPPVLEERILEGLAPSGQVRRLAEEKAGSVFSSHANSLVIAADTMVVLGSVILGKPESRDDAFDMLSLLSGKTHSVITASPSDGGTVRIGERRDPGLFQGAFRSTDQGLLSGGESGDKAGGLCYQGWGSLLVSSIRGCYFNVVGLPSFRLSRLLESVGIPLEEQWGERE
jgi:septum formation protein